MHKNITILTTGGTIAGSGSLANQAKYNSATISAKELINNVSEVNKLANIKCEELFSVASQDINDGHWLALAKRINKILEGDVDGVVVTHGTDTLEETAYFLNLTIKSSKPVILVGAIRPSTSLSSDGPINLYNAVALACNDDAKNKGVLVVMADKIFTGRDISKINAGGVEAFSGANSGIVGHILYGNSKIYYQPTRTHTTNSEFSVGDLEALPKVDIIYFYSGIDVNLIDCFVKSGSKAIIFAGVGGGNIPKNALEKLIAASEGGVLILKSSRTGNGFVSCNIEVEDDKFGFITTDNLSPQKARILAKLALCITSNSEQIKNIFAKY